MPLRVAVQMDPIEKINIKGDSTFALMLEAQARGHELFVYGPEMLSLRDNHLTARVRPVSVRDEVGNH
ncbi:MAG TPA: glutathione synthase, partial [Rhabdaerophilum sp.]|nr:glutathione synthase [Rhabdaerophilum sp.]